MLFFFLPSSLRCGTCLRIAATRRTVGILQATPRRKELFFHVKDSHFDPRGVCGEIRVYGLALWVERKKNPETLANTNSGAGAVTGADRNLDDQLRHSAKNDLWDNLHFS